MQQKLVIGLFSLMSITAAIPAFAQGEDSCYIEFAVSTPPVEFNQSVAFNVTNDYGFSKSITLKGGSAPQVIDKLLCVDAPYTISASQYSTPANQLAPGIGQCSLRAGSVMLNAPYNSVSVVFPNDFVCN
ncbi:hypothetical protein [Legionella israelensis]|uniref:Uncharacterized protein n=1 Tax=Legionella israelensis TaxID=454 RepID=A0A0W0VTQ0_9GAMM|nr:hypothetical protein [Legionella israelensis]KTD23357.1 hypothetical protein Lisr_1434 [Legionella israelensis]QBS09525.1 hypothetical protein E4T55_06445 [Legionella israelensis]SCY53567.1 hypothetical protein SAMN02746069_02785 [Legionella israelensis DSM 19235]STX60442.1 Uncharacterised protein [Legionella israelensis]